MAQDKVQWYAEVDSVTSYVNCYLKQAACTMDRVRIPNFAICTKHSKVGYSDTILNTSTVVPGTVNLITASDRFLGPQNSEQ